MSATLASSDAGAAPSAAHGPARSDTSHPWARRALARSLRLASVTVFLLTWQAVTSLHLTLGIVTFANVPSPVATWEALLDLLHSPKLAQHVGFSLWRVAVGFAIATVVGIALGLVVGRFAWARRTLLPPLELLRPIPAVSWIPLSVLMFPSTEASMIFITFLGAVFPVLLNTIHGVEGVDRRLVASARSLGTRRWQLFAQVIVPAAAPSIATGLAIGMGTCWFCLVSAEMISGQFGIGYYTWESYTVQNYGGIIVGMLLIGLLGMGSSALIRATARAMMPWTRDGVAQ